MKIHAWRVSIINFCIIWVVCVVYISALRLDDIPHTTVAPTPVPVITTAPTPAPVITAAPTPVVIPPTPAPIRKECDTDIDCNSLHVVNRSRCTMDFKCVCVRPYLGDRCELIWCGDYGLFDPLIQRCRCLPGYNGTYCTTCVRDYWYRDILWSTVCCNSSGVWVPVTIPAHMKIQFLSGTKLKPACVEPTSHQGKRLLSCTCELVDTLNYTRNYPNDQHHFLQQEETKLEGFFHRLTENAVSYGHSLEISYKLGVVETTRFYNSGEGDNVVGLVLLIIYIVLLFVLVIVVSIVVLRSQYKQSAKKIDTQFQVGESSPTPPGIDDPPIDRKYGGSTPFSQKQPIMMKSFTLDTSTIHKLLK